MKRRTFIQNTGAYAIVGLSGTYARCASHPHDGKIMTVLGPIDPKAMGVTLPHEHVLVDFIGAEKTGKHRYDEDEAFKVILPHLDKIKQLGCRTLIECTPAYIGRDPALLKRLAEATGMNLLTNTGYYAAANEKFVPPHAYKETVAQLAERWIGEWKNGIAGTGIIPGFIKIGVGSGSLKAIEIKLITSAARTHRETGLTVASHTGGVTAALEQLDILKKEGIHPSAWIWVHAQNGNHEDRARVARKGAWISIDKVAPKNVSDCLDMLKTLKDGGFLNQVMISHDAGWYTPGEPNGGNYRDYDTVFTEFLPALKKAGFSDSDSRQLIEINPQKAFTLQKRLLSSTSES